MAHAANIADGRGSPACPPVAPILAPALITIETLLNIHYDDFQHSYYNLRWSVAAILSNQII